MNKRMQLIFKPKCLFFTYFLLLVSCNKTQLVCFQNKINASRYNPRISIFLDTTNKTFVYSKKIEMYYNEYEGKYVKYDENYYLLNEFSIKNCFKTIAEKRISDSISVNLYSFSNKREQRGILLVVKDDSTLLKKMGVLSNMKIDKKYAAQGNSIYLANYSNYEIKLDSNFNFYNIVYNDVHCSKNYRIVDIDTFKIIYDNGKYILGHNEIEKCSCKKIK